MGPPFDVSAVPAAACRAPELEGVTEWINSPPLTLASLRGKVVVVHFYTFGCINCIRNLPHYNAWRERFDRDELVIVGIHRPETQKEYDVAEVRRKAAEAGLKYPIAVDNESRNWNAWANSVWPSVYLIDKSGFVRYWWHGELNWQGAKGDQWMRSRMAELLAARN
jgi:peroxiredoxin